jgi:hypothetical protein
MNKNSDTDNDDPTPVADRLPFPTDEDLEIALSERNLDWGREFMESSSLGEILLIQGIRLQTISNETVRCIGIVDHPQSWDLLLKLFATFCALGVSIQLDPYAIIIPYIEPEEEEELEAKEEIADWMWS